MLSGKINNALFLVLLLGLASAALYVCLLPLWEGFDEPFHYGYVQLLSARHRFPVLGKTRLEAGIRQSLTLTPVSPILERSLPNSFSFAEWFRLPREERLARRKALSGLPSEMGPSDLNNYEAQQAPLAYVLLSPLNVMVDSRPLAQRILVLRLFAAICCTLLLFAASVRLASVLGLGDRFGVPALVCIFETQMLWAAVAHVSNDWLAVPIATAFLGILGAAAGRRNPSDLIVAGILLGLGLLTKGYFLAFVPVFLALAVYEKVRSRIRGRTLLAGIGIPVLLAGPWYGRNVVLYGNLSAMQEAQHGIGVHQALGALFQINWGQSMLELARSSLWTGNWSFTVFSRNTLNAELILLAAGFLLLAVYYRQITKAELWIFAALVSFLAALAYDACVTWADTHGAALHASPWYTQCILPAIWMLAFLGFERGGITGRILAWLTALVGAWIAAVTYVAKLFPQYGGFEGRANVAGIWGWWTHDPNGLLSNTALLAGPLLFGVLIVFLALLVAVNANLLRRFA